MKRPSIEERLSALEAHHQQQHDEAIESTIRSLQRAIGYKDETIREKDKLIEELRTQLGRALARA